MPSFPPCTDAELAEIRRQALLFKRQARFTSPAIFHGQKVANLDPAARVRNFSTITRIVRLADGRTTFLIYRYPLYFIHWLSDTFFRFVMGLRCYKPLRRSVWQRIFEEKSLIPIIPIGIPGIVALPYLDNWNLHDVLAWSLGNLDPTARIAALRQAAAILNWLHAENRVWGEPIAQNFLLRKDNREVVLCDTEVIYYPWVPLAERKMLDWRSFIFSFAGANRRSQMSTEETAVFLFRLIADGETRRLLRESCRRPMTFGQLAGWGSLRLNSSCTLKKYRAIKRALSLA